MTLKTSSNKLNPAINMLRHTFSKNKGLLILLSVAMLIYCPGFVLMRITEYIENDIWVDFYDFLSGFSLTVTIIAGICVVFFNLINFKYLYSKKSSDVFHSLPITRSELFFSRSVAGFLLTLIPVLFGYISITCIAFFIPEISATAALPFILINFAYTAMTMSVCAAFSAVFAVCAGTAFDYMLSFLGFNGGLLLCGVIMTSVFDNLLMGYSSDNITEILKNVSPIYFCINGLADYLNYESVFSFRDAMFFVRTGIYTISFTIISVLLYNHRKAEKGGEAYAYKFIYILCALIAGFCGAYIIGSTFTDNKYNIAFWIFAALGGIGSTVAYGAISDRGFKTFKKSIVLGISSVAMIGCAVAIVSAGGFGFTDYIPQNSNVKSVIVGYDGNDIEFNDANLSIEIHRTIIENKQAVAYDNEANAMKAYISFHYELKNGNYVNRDFWIERDFFADELLKLYQSDEYVDGILEAFTKYGGATADFHLVKPYAESDICTYITSNELTTLLKLYKNEVQNATTRIITDVDSTLQCSFSWSNHKYYYYPIYLDDTFKETKELLNSLNLEQRAESDNMTETLSVE